MEKKSDYRQKAFEQTREVSGSIAQQISQQLINDPTWLDRFMDETGATYAGSVFGKRIRHFFYEKKMLAKEVIKKIDDYLKDDDLRYCLIIDSGTSMYPLFREITEMVQDEKRRNIWKERIYIISNNIPGVQYLMKNGKEDPYNDYSEIWINCFLLPGKPLSVYGAITGDETVEWLSKIEKFLEKEWECARDEYRILGFVTGNYFARHQEDDGQDDSYYPVARGEGHVEIKLEIVNRSDEIFLLSPLMKFSFAGVDLLNKVNDFVIERNNVDAARNLPQKVKYEEIPITDKKCTFFTTGRKEGDTFHSFSNSLQVDLNKKYGRSNIVLVDFDLKHWIPNIENDPQLEIEREIPHQNLRDKYQNDNNIWDKKWVQDNENLI